MIDHSALLPGLRALARRAGVAILEVYHGEFAVSRKEDASPVTEADLRSERIIIEGLRTLTPGIPVIAEEQESAGHSPAHRDRFWLVDPLDGTREFVKRNGQFTVNIGLIEGGRPVAGVLYAPAAELMFSAAGGLAMLEERGEKARPIRCRKPPRDGLIVLASASHRDAEPFDKFLAPFPVKEIRRSGSALKYGMLAAGEADIYPRFGRTMEWDTAAGHAILEAAGGCLTLPDGRPLGYGKPGWDNPSCVAWATPFPYPDGKVPAG